MKTQLFCICRNKPIHRGLTPEMDDRQAVNSISNSMMFHGGRSGKTHAQLLAVITKAIKIYPETLHLQWCDASGKMDPLDLIAHLCGSVSVIEKDRITGVFHGLSFSISTKKP